MWLAIGASTEWFSQYAVLKLDPAGQNIVYKTLLDAAPEAMAVDAAGDVFLAGSAGSGFGTTAGAYQPQPAPCTCASGAGLMLGQSPSNDAFAIKLSPSGALVWATYLGGSGKDDSARHRRR
jgi:hypothetical protein